MDGQAQSNMPFTFFKVGGIKIGVQDQLSLNAGQKYCRMLRGEHSAIFSTFIELPFVIKIFVLSFFEWLLKTGFTVKALFHCRSWKASCGRKGSGHTRVQCEANIEWADRNVEENWVLRRENLLSVFCEQQNCRPACAVWSATLLFTYWKVSYLDWLRANFEFSN